MAALLHAHETLGNAFRACVTFGTASRSARKTQRHLAVCITPQSSAIHEKRPEVARRFAAENGIGGDELGQIVQFVQQASGLPATPTFVQQAGPPAADVQAARMQQVRCQAPPRHRSVELGLCCIDAVRQSLVNYFFRSCTEKIWDWPPRGDGDGL